MHRVTHSKFKRNPAGMARIPGWALSGAIAFVALLPCAAGAATVTLDGSGGMTYSYQYVAPNSTTPAVGDNYDLAVPGQYTFTDTFTTPQSSSQNLGTSSVGAYDFQDSYQFTVGTSASGDTLLASLGPRDSVSTSRICSFACIKWPAPRPSPSWAGCLRAARSSPHGWAWLPAIIR